MSILKSKHGGWLSDGTRTPFDGGGGGGGGQQQPTQSTSYNTNVPEYARPYVENMLQSTQKQIYNDDMTTFRPYTPYSTDVNNYFADFSPMQKYAQSETANMQTPGQFGAATGLSGIAGMGGLSSAGQASALGSQALGYGEAGSVYGDVGAQQALRAARQTGRQAGMYGGMGAGYGGRGVQAAEQGFGAGEAFARQATDPYATQAYMSPYMQNVVDFQKQSALRDFQVAQPMRQAEAVAKGAFGGSRQAIVDAEAQRNLNTQLQGIQATGTQKAFEDAQRQQQFGANLGLQGLQAGYGGLGLGMQGAGLGLQGVGAQQAAGQLGLAGTAQGMQGAGMGLQGVQGALGAGQYGLQGYGLANTAAGQLASIGGQQQSADLARLQAQYGMGKEQQTMEQNKINQAISNYATAQQYPFMQLGIMNSMLRGLPLQQTTTATYQQQPSTTQQLAGLAGAGMSYFGGGRKEGGVIEMKEGGTVPGYKYGDLISDPQLQGMSQGLSPQQLQGRIADPQVTPNERGIFQSTQQAQQRMASNPMAAQQMAQAAPPPQMAQAPSEDARMGGIAQAGGDMFNTMGYAGGGIIAFAGEGPSLVDEAIAKAERDAAAQDAAAKEKKAPVKTAAKDVKAAPKEAAPASREDYLAQTQALMEKQGFKPGATADEQAYADMVAKQQAGLGASTSAKERANLAKAFLKMGSNARGFLPGAIEGAESYLTGAGEIAAGKEAREMTLAEARSKYSAAQRARAAGDIASSDKLFDEARKLESQANIAKNRDATAIRTAEISSAASKLPYQMQKEEKEAVRAELRTKLGREPTMTEVIAAYSTASNKTAETTVQGQIETALAKDDEYKMLGLQLSNPEIDPTTKAKIIARRKEIYNEITARVSKNNPQTAENAVPVQNQDGTVTIPGKGTFKKLPNGNYAPV